MLVNSVNYYEYHHVRIIHTPLSFQVQILAFRRVEGDSSGRSTAYIPRTIGVSPFNQSDWILGSSTGESLCQVSMHYAVQWDRKGREKEEADGEEGRERKRERDEGGIERERNWKDERERQLERETCPHYELFSIPPKYFNLIYFIWVPIDGDRLWSTVQVYTHLYILKENVK